MDSFFDYIILLFFIISMLSSLFKKKKTPPVDTGSGGEFGYYGEEDETATVENTSIKSEGMDDYSKLEYNIDKSSEAAGSYNSPFEDEYSELLKDRKKRSMEVTIMSEESGVKTETINFRAKIIKDKLQNPETFKDFFIVTELLNKPLGLRDDG